LGSGTRYDGTEGTESRLLRGEEERYNREESALILSASDDDSAYGSRPLWLTSLSAF
jgi:hypothetical protein